MHLYLHVYMQVFYFKLVLPMPTCFTYWQGPGPLLYVRGTEAQSMLGVNGKRMGSEVEKAGSEILLATGILEIYWESRWEFVCVLFNRCHVHPIKLENQCWYCVLEWFVICFPPLCWMPADSCCYLLCSFPLSARNTVHLYWPIWPPWLFDEDSWKCFMSWRYNFFFYDYRYLLWFLIYL